MGTNSGSVFLLPLRGFDLSNSVVSTLEDKESSLLSLFQPPVEEKVRSLQLTTNRYFTWITAASWPRLMFWWSWQLQWIQTWYLFVFITSWPVHYASKEAFQTPRRDPRDSLKLSDRSGPFLVFLFCGPHHEETEAVVMIPSFFVFKSLSLRPFPFQSFRR